MRRSPACDLSRFRPITLTAISTVLGLIPIDRTVFWGPTASSVKGAAAFDSADTRRDGRPLCRVIWDQRGDLTKRSLNSVRA